jgi:hypothetical protein
MNNAIRQPLKRICAGLAGITALLALSNCNNAEQTVSPEAESSIHGQEAPAPKLITGRDAAAKTAGTSTYLHFGDRAACQWNPDICNNSFTIYPGYYQQTGLYEWGQVWMSTGPGSGPIPYDGRGASESSRHYHIMGFIDPKLEPNPRATSMFGTDWLYVTMYRNNTHVNFDLTEIKNLGTVPIQIWYKDAAGKFWYWKSIGPGWWSLYAYNIQEVHISSTSGLGKDQFIIDDIQVKTR